MCEHKWGKKQIDRFLISKEYKTPDTGSYYESCFNNVIYQKCTECGEYKKIDEQQSYKRELVGF